MTEWFPMAAGALILWQAWLLCRALGVVSLRRTRRRKAE